MKKLKQFAPAVVVLNILIVICTLCAGTPAACQKISISLTEDCSSYADLPLPADAPNGPTPQIYPDCSSYRSYRGIGRPVDYAAAWSCAWKERQAQQAKLRQNPNALTEWVVGGSLILADIYANGAGVERNLPLAMRFACEFEPAAAEQAWPDLVKLEHATVQQKPFELCDDGMTTFTMNFCSGYSQQIEDEQRRRVFEGIKASMGADQKKAFEALLAAQHAYVEAHAAEVDQGGTIRTMRTIGSINILNENFQADVLHYERGKFPNLSAKQVAGAASILQRELKQKEDRLALIDKDDIDGGAVTAQDLTKVEQAWEPYHQAWVAFAALRYPLAAQSIDAKVTLDRYWLVVSISAPIQ